MEKWDIKRVSGHLYTKPFFLCEPVSYSASAVLPAPKIVIPQQSNEPSHGPSTASMKSRTMLQVLNCLLHVCAQMHSGICMNVHGHAGWVGGWMYIHM